MEIKIELSDCKSCKEGLRYFKLLQKQHKRHYANMNMKNYTLIDGIYLSPDYNCSGHLTHFHISKADKITLKRTIEAIERQEKESKTIMKAKKDGRWKKN
jgi:hypothetical protein